MANIMLPTVFPPSDAPMILVTGINGYIGSHIGLLLLQKGYTVRGTSRNISHQTALLTTVFGPYASSYQPCVVPDIVVPGAFDSAVQGVTGIIHVASPVDFSLTTLDEYMVPAVNGVLSILNSAAAYAGPQMKSFVLTSSVSAITDRWRQPQDHVYTESDWNTSGEGVARANFFAPFAYGASKAKAERTMWDWLRERQEQNANPSKSDGKVNGDENLTHQNLFACTAIQPGVVTGPPVFWPETPDKLNETLQPVWKIFSIPASKTPDFKLPLVIGYGFNVDVRDVAELHVWCVENPPPLHPNAEDSTKLDKVWQGENRYICTNGRAPPQAIADILRKHYPERDIIVGDSPGIGYGVDYWYTEGEASMIATRAYRDMGVEKFRYGYEESILDSVKAMEEQWPDFIANT